MRFKRIDNINLIEDNNIYGIFCNEKKLILGTENFIEGLKKIHCDFNWVHANPSKKNIAKISDYYFYQNEDIKIFLEELKEKIIHKQKLIFILGRRGGGKTFIQNYFLNTQTRELNSKSITWIRIDITKIYTAKAKYRLDINVLDYLYAQIVFVYLRYSKQRNEHTEDTVFRKVKDNYREKIFQDIFISDKDKKNYINTILNTEYNDDGIIGKPFKNIETQRIAKRILKYINESNQFIFLIADGLDNVDFHYLHRGDLVKKFITPLLELNEENKYFSSVVLSFRSELNLSPTLQDTYEKMIGYTTDATIPTVDFQSFWQWFVDKIANLSDEYKVKYFGTSNIDSKLLNEFKRYLENINDIVKNELNRLNVSEALLSDFNILTHLYDKDIREMKENVLSSYIYIKEFIKNYNINHSQSKKSDINIDTILNNMQYIIIEAIFKNGMRYAPDVRIKKYTPPYRNLGFTNIFNPTEINSLLPSSVVIPPLLYLFLLKYLSHKSETYNKIMDDFKFYLQSDFSNNVTNYIRQAFEELLEYNYVTYAYNNRIETLEITNKGKIVLDITFKNIDVFHANIYFSLIDKDSNLKFGIFDPDGKMYITKTLENVVKYLHFLVELQDKMLNIENMKGNPLRLNIITDEIKKSYRRLYIIENKSFINLNIEESVKPTFDILVSDIDSCLELIRKSNINELIKYVEKHLPELNIEGKSFIIFDILTFIHNLDENEKKIMRIRLEEFLYLPLIDSYLNYKENTTLILQILDDYVHKTTKFKFILTLCDAMYSN